MYRKIISMTAIALGGVLIFGGAGCVGPFSLNTPRSEAPAVNSPTANSPAATVNDDFVQEPDVPEKAAPAVPVAAPVNTPVNRAANTTEKPVEYTYLGIAPDKEHFIFKIKILSTNPIRQVDIESTCTNESGEQDQSTYAWQNIVNSVQLPIEQGKTYEATSYSGDGTVKCETGVGLVHFADGTKWKNGL